MTMLLDGSVALLAAFGAAALIWLAATAPGRRETLPAVLMVPLQGRAEQMEYIVRSLTLRRSRAGSQIPIVLVDAGLAPEARRQAAWLAGELPGVLLLNASEIPAYWKKQGEDHGRTRDRGGHGRAYRVSK